MTMPRPPVRRSFPSSYAANDPLPGSRPVIPAPVITGCNALCSDISRFVGENQGLMDSEALFSLSLPLMAIKGPCAYLRNLALVAKLRAMRMLNSV